MNLRRDTLLIVLAGLVFLAALIFGALKLGLAPSLVRPVVLGRDDTLVAIPELKAPARGGDYPSTPQVRVAEDVSDWLSPEENEDAWNYDLFTTIDIVWDPLIKEYVPRGRKVDVMPPFGVALAKVGHPAYPYVVRSTMAGRSGKDEDREFSIENVETKQYFDRCKLNKPIDPAVAIVPVSFKLVKDKDKDGFIQARNVLRLDDRLLGRIVEIDDLKVLEFTDQLDIHLFAVADPAKKWVLHAVGDKFAYEGAQYVVKGVDLATKTVSVEKTFILNPRKKNAAPTTVTEVLSMPTTPVRAPSPPPAKKPLPKKP